MKKGFTLHHLQDKIEIDGKGTRNGAGFTLIEIMVTIFIIAMVSSIMVVNWRKNEKRYQLQMAVQGIIQNIRKAQDMALTGKKIGSEDVPPSYGVYFDKQDADNYIIFGDKNGNNTYQPADDISIDNISIESGVEISLPMGPNLNITFSLPDGFTIIKPSAVSATIIVKKTGATCPSSDCKSIIIRNTGQIITQ